MKYKKNILLLMLFIFLFAISAVNAIDVNDKLISSENADQTIVSLNDEITDDNLQISEENNILTQTNEILGVDESTYSELAREIGTGGNITLTHDYYTYDSGSTITIGVENSVIDGNGAVIDMAGSTNMRALYVSVSSVTIKNITIKNAIYNGDGGGAIYFSGSGTVTNCNFTNNIVRTGLYSYGGAVYFSSSGEVTNCNFVNNTDSQRGSAVYFSGNGEVTNCNFTDNSATDDGGAVYFSSSGEVTNCNFTDNHANYEGGAVYFLGSGEVRNCNFTNNSAFESCGAIRFNGKGNVTNCTFTGNTVSNNGGAIRIFSGNVTNCTFTDNTASNNGGAVWIFSGSVENCNFTDNSAIEDGGAVFFVDECTVKNCNFTNNSASRDGGAIMMYYGSVSNCNFTNNTASRDGGALWMYSGCVENCNFTDNKATSEGGAIRFGGEGTVTNCNFTDNEADIGGAILFNENGNVSNCNFIDNNATTGSAIYFRSTSDNKTVSNSLFLNNRANAEALEVTKNDDNITIIFTGQNNLLNAIYSRDDAEVTFTNVTYWSANGITNTGTSPTTPARSNKEAGQNITVGIVVNDKFVLSDVIVTDENGMIILDIKSGDNYYISICHDADSYYTEVEKTISNNTKFNVNVTSQTTHNKTVNITAKSNIFSESMLGKLLFILPKCKNITANYSDNGTWWALHTFDDYGVYQVSASYVGLGSVTINNGTISISKTPTEIIVENTTVNLFVRDSVGSGASLTPADAGNITFTSSNPEVAKVENGKIMAVSAGNATITVTYAGDNKYAPSNATVSVKVSKSQIKPEIKQNDTTLTVSVPEDATGDVTVTIGNKTIKAPIKDGKAVINLSDVPAGDYNATVSYPGDNKYSGFEVVAPVNIESKFQLIIENLTKYYHGPERFAVKALDGKGNHISGAKVKISLNGMTYTRVTDENGSASIGVNLESGVFIATVSCNNTTVEATITVLTTVNGTDLVKVFRNATQYYATFRDTQGNYLKDGTAVRFNIHGVFYDRTVSGDKGLAKLNINLEQGEYIITAINLETGESRANNITVLPRIVENYDLTKYYRNASQYTVKLIGNDGNPVGAGENVTFNINGVFYTRTTNASGIAKLNINLQPGDYIITAGYKNCMVSNKIKVLPVLTAKELTKKYGTKDQFVASLVYGQGKAYAGQSIQFNINGVFYNRITDSNGQAKLNINLQPGEYIITSTYNGASIGDKITVTA